MSGGGGKRACWRNGAGEFLGGLGFGAGEGRRANRPPRRSLPLPKELKSKSVGDSGSGSGVESEAVLGEETSTSRKG